MVDDAPCGHWHTTTMISSLRMDGSTPGMVVDGATDKDVFGVYVQHILLPTLKAGDIVVLDNLSVHKHAEAIAMIESVDAVVWFLPPYSPDLNPIEKMWSKVNQFLRSTKARTIDDLIKAIADALKIVSNQDAQAWFMACGYQSTKW